MALLKSNTRQQFINNTIIRDQELFAHKMEMSIIPTRENCSKKYTNWMSSNLICC